MFISEDISMTDFRMLDYWTHIQDIALLHAEMNALDQPSDSHLPNKKSLSPKKMRMMPSIIIIPEL